VILVGEIRDTDTARMALQAAMTGHQVYSTLHTNSAIGAIPRLLDIGIQPDILAGNLIGIVAQRLVRRLCPACREAYPASAHELQLLGLGASQPQALLYRATGCARCDFQGYRGRLAIIELLRLNASLDELIARRASAREILHVARDSGFVSLAENGASRVLEGSTTLDELARVIDLSDYARQ
jgi:general secretion pathway protein E/type IV pilus assembly protein PilB